MKNRSIKFDILFRIIASVALSIVVIVSYNMSASRQLLIESAKSFVKKQDENALNALLDYMASINSAKNFIAPVYKELGINSKILDSQLIRMLVNIDPVDAIEIKKNKSNVLIKCVQIRPESNVKSIYSHAVPENTNYYIVRRNNTGAIIYYYDSNAVLLKEVFLGDEYSDADEHHSQWPNACVHDKLTFIEKNEKLNNDGEISSLSIKINLGTLSWILNNLRLTDRTRIFIVDQQMNVVADSDVVSNSKLMTVDEYGNNKLKIAIDLFEKNKNVKKAEKTNFFTVDKDSFFSIVTETPNNLGLHWKIVTVTSIKDFVDKFYSIEMKCFIISIFIMFLVLSFLYFQIQKLSEPINFLSVEADKITNIDLGDPVIVNSKLAEIVDLNDAMQRVKISITNFSKYIPKGLIRHFVDSGEVVKIGGQSKNITILFSDVANFTTISEQTEPQALIAQLSEYFEAMSTIILENRGTIDKFIGDAVMAFWGAPEENNDQFVHACKAALVCQQKLRGLNKYWVAENKPALITRIGVHCGAAVVGNIGSAERMNYTALGDSVNLAARLEGTNKMYGTLILISEDMQKKLPADFITRPLDIVAVKGKLKGVKIYELIALDNDSYLTSPTQTVKDFALDFAKAFDLYLNKEWSEALASFQKLKNDNSYDGDQVTDMYIERCKEFMVSPPDANWEGVMHLKEK